MKCPHCDGTGELGSPSIGDAVLAYRKQRGLTQAQLAEKSEVTRSHIANLETGRSDVPVSTLMRIADALGVPAKDLLP